eukprot:scaffold497_cov368-Prasinococcus_capsulatus_cf.AAC.8
MSARDPCERPGREHVGAGPLCAAAVSTGAAGQSGATYSLSSSVAVGTVVGGPVRQARVVGRPVEGVQDARGGVLVQMLAARAEAKVLHKLAVNPAHAPRTPTSW